MVSQIRFKNFKIFRQWQTLELRPITILLGKNNSGKSAVAKLPVMIAGSLSGKYSAPLPLSHEGIRIAFSNEELFYNKNHSERVELIIEASNSSKIEVAVSGGIPYKPDIHLRKYLHNNIDIDIKKNKFKGFTTPAVDISAFLFKLDYIDSIRVVLPAQNDTEEEFDKIGVNGENTYKILHQCSINNDSVTFSEINQWFKANFQDWEVEVKEIQASSPLFEIVLSNSKVQNIGIESTGSGIKQVLPLIVRSFMPVSEPTLIIIEEPETHLHPAAHGTLAERFAKSYLENNNRKYLIETHSQNFVLRMRGLIAEGELNPNDLAIYYVDFDEEENESSMKMIEVDKNGDLPNNDWPSGVFNETSLEVKKIIQAQRNKGL